MQQKRPNLESVEAYAWHGTTGQSANKIVKEGFDSKRIGKKFGKLYGYQIVILNYCNLERLIVNGINKFYCFILTHLLFTARPPRRLVSKESPVLVLLIELSMLIVLVPPASLYVCLSFFSFKS